GHGEHGTLGIAEGDHAAVGGVVGRAEDGSAEFLRAAGGRVHVVDAEEDLPAGPDPGVGGVLETAAAHSRDGALVDPDHTRSFSQRTSYRPLASQPRMSP